MYKLELFTRVRSPYIWRTRKRANAPDIVNRHLSAASERALASRDILIFASSALKTWVLHINTFYSRILYISPVAAVNRSKSSNVYFPYVTRLFQLTKIRMFLYARIYWLAEFGNISCLQFNYLRVETLTPTWDTLTLTLTPTWEDFVGRF